MTVVVRNRELMFDPGICSGCENRTTTMVIVKSAGHPHSETHLAFCPTCFAQLQSAINAYVPPIPSA